MQKRRPLAFVSGSTSGIGYSTARVLIENGYDLIIHYRASVRNLPNLRALARKHGAKLVELKADFSDAEQLTRCAEDVARHAITCGGLSAAVFCAGKNEKRPYLDVSIDDFKNIFAVNTQAPFFTVQCLVARAALRSGASIITVGTPNGFVGGGRRNMLYTMSKMSLLGLTKSLAKDLAPTIRVNCVVPGYIETRMLTGDTSQKELTRKKGRIPLRRFGTPDEVANVISFLVSEEASYITGQSVHVNGGLILT